jgi:hypothetical protein
MNANCPKCQQQTTFVFVENNKYQCDNCKAILHKCHTDGCINMITRGWYCSKCVGRGVKALGAGAITVIVGIGALAYGLTKNQNNDE